MAPGPPLPTPESIFAAWLVESSGGEHADFEALCRAHAAHDRPLRVLYGQFLALEPALRLSGLLQREGESGRSFAARLARKYGQGVDPKVSLDEAGSGAPSGRPTQFVQRMTARASERARYRIEGEIARGGMGAILKIWDEDLRRNLAMKVILGQEGAALDGTPSRDERQLARFLEEAQVTGQLDHPGIVPVHELGLDADGRVYFTMKLVKGRDLKHVFDRVFAQDPEWTETRALGVMLKVCEAMAYAHKKGVIHRDLKPANVMVGSFGEVYVMDWGLARVQGRQDSHDIRLKTDFTVSVKSVKTERRDEREDTPDSPLITMDGDVMGTPAYMPPEQARGEIDKLGARSDVYALGSMLYHLLARQMPYVPASARMTNRTVLGLVQQGPPAPLHSLRKDLPAELVAICEKAMARAMESRYADTLELAGDLRAYLEGRVVKAYRTGAVVELRKWVARNQPLAASIAAGFLVALGSLAWISLVQAEKRAAIEEQNRTTVLLTLGSRHDGLAEEADRLWPVTDAALAPQLAEWVRTAEELSAPSTLEALRSELETVRSRGRHPSPEERVLEIGRDPRARELARRRERAAILRTILARVNGATVTLPPEWDREPDWALLPSTPAGLNEIAWKAVSWEVEGGLDLSEPVALKIVEHALTLPGSAAQHELVDTHAWALLKNGYIDRAVAMSREAFDASRGEEDPARRDQMDESNRRLMEASVEMRAPDTLEKMEHEIAGLERSLEQLTAELAADTEWRFESVTERAQYRYFLQLIPRLERFADPMRGLLRGVTPDKGLGVARRLEHMTSVEERTRTGAAARAAWDRALASIRDRERCPKYAGLVIEPQLGLLPVGRDEESGLWEFAYTLTGAPPMRGANGRWKLEEGTAVVLVLVPGGRFHMGAQADIATAPNHAPDALPDEGPVREIELAPYFLSKYELTQGQWCRVAGRNTSGLRAGVDRGGTRVDLRHPLENVSWADATKWLARVGLDLPTEAQWERAARAGRSDVHVTGDEADELDGAANVRDQTLQEDARLGNTEEAFETAIIDGFVIHAPVGEYRANDYGLHDLAGNVWEWCRDTYGPYDVLPAPGDGLRRPFAGQNRVARGGSFLEAGTEARISRRNEDLPTYAALNLGLRPARAVEGEVRYDQ